MNFQKRLQVEDRAKHISELPTGELLEQDRLNVIIPICCREGWESCPHVAKKEKAKKRNIAV